MDWNQLIIAIIIPLIVSLFVWTLTYIAPYIMPRQLSNTILFFTQFQKPKDPNEIRVYVNQYLKYADWKMLTAKGMLERVFERKFNKFEEEEKEFWKELKDKVEAIPIKDAINEIELLFEEYGEPKEIKKMTKNQAGVYIGGPPNGLPGGLPGGQSLKKLLEIYQGWYDKSKSTKIWRFKELSREDLHKILDIDITPNPEQGQPAATIMGKKMPYRAYTSTEFARFKAMENMKLIEVDGKWIEEVTDESNIPSPESFLVRVGIEKPIDMSESERYKLFNKILLNLDLSQEDNIKGFSIALSDMDESMQMFEKIIKEGSDITPLKTRFLNKLKSGDNL